MWAFLWKDSTGIERGLIVLESDKPALTYANRAYATKRSNL
jgi:hypothetical protein